MPTDLRALIAAPASGRVRSVLLDGDDYAQSVLLQGRAAPVGEPMAYANYFGQVQDLLQPDAGLLDLGAVYARRLDEDSLLRAAMGSRPRTGFALRTMLGDPDLTKQAAELATVVVQTQRRPVVLQLPSPRQWLAGTHHLSGASDTGALNADDAENASMYVADWLRAFATLPLAGVLLDDRDPTPGAGVPLEVYSPISNTTDNYRWTLGMRHETHVELRGSELVGTLVPTAFWLDEDLDPPDGDFLLGQIPVAAVPEVVLRRVAVLGRGVPAEGE